MDARTRQRRARLTPAEGHVLVQHGGAALACRVQTWLLREAVLEADGLRDVESVPPKAARAAARRVLRQIRRLQTVLVEVPRDLHEWVGYYTPPGPVDVIGPLAAALAAAEARYAHASTLHDARPRRRDVERRARRVREVRLLLPRAPRLPAAARADVVRVVVAALARIDGTRRGADDVARWVRDVTSRRRT